MKAKGRVLVKDVAIIAGENRERIISVEKGQISMQGQITDNAEAIGRQEGICKTSQKTLKAVGDFSIEAKQTLKILGVIGGAIGLSVLGLLMSLLFGQASITFH